MEDDAFIEDDPDKAPPPPPVPWRLMARYLGQSLSSPESPKTHFAKVWRLQSGVKFAMIKSTCASVTLFLDGDYRFETEGEPWIHLRNVLIVKPLSGAARPTETDLRSVPIWVHMYDIRCDKQNEVNGRKWGNNLKVDINPQGTNLSDYQRVRIIVVANNIGPIFVQPLAVMQDPFVHATSSITPALRGLSSWVTLENTADTMMLDVSSMLGKRLASHKDDKADSQVDDHEIVLHQYVDNRNSKKRGRMKPEGVVPVGTGTMEGIETLGATSLGAAGQLMGTRGAPRQQ
jgi:hypothetical protein